MSTYRLSDTPSPQYARLKWQLPLLMAALVFAAFLCAQFGRQWQALFPQFPDLPHALALLLLAGAFILGCAFCLMLRRYLKGRSQFILRITPEGVFRQWPPLPDMSLPREAILGFMERKPGHGFAIRSNNPMRAIGVPSDLAGYEECQAELVSQGIPKLPFDVRRVLWPAMAPLVVMLVALAAMLSGNRLEVIAGLVGFLGAIIWSRQRAGRLRDFGWWLSTALLALLLIWNHRIQAGLHTGWPSPTVRALSIFSVGLIAVAWQLYEKWRKPKA